MWPCLLDSDAPQRTVVLVRAVFLPQQYQRRPLAPQFMVQGPIVWLHMLAWPLFDRYCRYFKANVLWQTLNLNGGSGRWPFFEVGSINTIDLAEIV